MTLRCQFSGESITDGLQERPFLGPLDLFVCGMDVPLSYSHIGRYVVLSVSLSFKNCTRNNNRLSYHL